MRKIIKIAILVLIIIVLVFLFRNIKNYRIHKILTDDYVSKYYVNELYKSKEINYRMVLDEKEKNIYGQIIEGIISFKNEIAIDMTEYKFKNNISYSDKMQKIIHCLVMDHPELIHFGWYRYRFNLDTKNLTIFPDYVMTKEKYKESISEITFIIDEVKNATVNMNEYEKVKYVYEYIGKSNNYGNTEDLMAQSAYSAFNKTLSPVCSGYAKSSQILFNNIGINALLIIGDQNYSLLLGEKHAWNAVEIERKFYLYDVTWSNYRQGEQFYEGFLLDPKRHKPYYKKSVPYLSKSNFKL